MQPARISFVNPSGEIGGAERAILLLLRHLDRSRYSPSFVCLSEGRLVEALRDLEVPVAVVPLRAAERLSRSAGSSLGSRAQGAAALGGTAARLVRCLRTQRPDLIHTNGIKAHLIGGVAGRVLGQPVVWHMRDLVAAGRGRSLFNAAGAHLPQRIIGVSTMVTEQFSASRRASRRAVTVHDAVDVANYKAARAPEAVRKQLGIPPGRLVLMMVAHFTRWKGHLVFLEAVSRLLRQGLPVSGVVVGSSIYRNAAEQAYEAEVRGRVEALGLGEHLVFTGFQDRVADFIQAADVLIHPPIQPEPFGLAVIEAMALSRPVIGAASGGMLETIEPEVTGLLAKPGDAASFADAIARLANDPTRREAMGRSGRERVTRLFTPEHHMRQVDRIYRELLPAT